MSLDVSRLRRSDRIVGGSALALFIFMFFFKWFGVSSNVGTIAGINVNVSRDGWNTFTNSRWIWLITIIVALLYVAVRGGALQLSSPIPLSAAVAGLGALSTVLIFYRILHHPTASASFGSFHASVGIKIGIWLGLIAAAAITYGGYLAMRDDGTSLADVRDQASAAVSGMGSSHSSPSTHEPSPAEGAMGTAATPTEPPPAAGTPPIPPPAPGAGGA